MPNNSDILELKFLIRISNQTFLGYEFIILTPHAVCFDLIIFYVRCNILVFYLSPSRRTFYLVRVTFLRILTIPSRTLICQCWSWYCPLLWSHAYKSVCARMRSDETGRNQAPS